MAPLASGCVTARCGSLLYSYGNDESNKTSGTPLEFTALNQDRIAIGRLEYRRIDHAPRKNALGLIRNGQIELAARALVNEWTSLLGGKDARKGKPGNIGYAFTISDLISVYERNLSELLL